MWRVWWDTCLQGSLGATFSGQCWFKGLQAQARGAVCVCVRVRVLSCVL